MIVPDRPKNTTIAIAPDPTKSSQNDSRILKKKNKHLKKEMEEAKSQNPKTRTS